MKLKDIKSMVKNGTAKDITEFSTKEYRELLKAENGLDKIKITNGKYLINGALVKGCTTGQCYAILERTSILLDILA